MDIFIIYPKIFLKGNAGLGAAGTDPWVCPLQYPLFSSKSHSLRTKTAKWGHPFLVLSHILCNNLINFSRKISHSPFKPFPQLGFLFLSHFHFSFFFSFWPFDLTFVLCTIIVCGIMRNLCSVECFLLCSFLFAVLVSSKYHGKFLCSSTFLFHGWICIANCYGF